MTTSSPGILFWIIDLVRKESRSRKDYHNSFLQDKFIEGDERKTLTDVADLSRYCYLTASFRLFPGKNLATVFAGICIVAPV